MKVLTIILFFLILLSSCDQSWVDVKFTEPQPESVKASNSFDKKVLGTYSNFYNSDQQLIIQKNLMISRSVFKLTIHRNDIELDSLSFNNDAELISYLNQDGGITYISNDSIIRTHIIYDTIFSFSNNQVLKSFKASYYLNYEDSNGLWNVRKLDINKDTLLFGEILPSDTLLRFDYVDRKYEAVEDSGKIENEYTEYILSPSKREFKKLVRTQSFEIVEKYIRAK